MNQPTKWRGLVAVAGMTALTTGGIITSGILQAGANPMHQAAPEIAAKTIRWQPSLAAAEKESQQTGKPIMVIFHATWCGACRVLEQQTLTNPKVIEAAQQWVAVKVDVDEQQQIADAYGVRNLPTTGFFRAAGGPKLGFVGAAGPDDMVKILKTAYDKLEKSNSEKK